jgi:hypothetical protein
MKNAVMTKRKQQETFDNRAAAVALDNANCSNCGEPLVFALKDSRGQTFSVGLSMIIRCLRLAESESAIPQLPPEWWKTTLNL